MFPVHTGAIDAEAGVINYDSEQQIDEVGRWIAGPEDAEDA